MKKVLFLVLCLIVGIAQGMAESPSELFRGDCTADGIVCESSWNGEFDRG